MPRYSFECDACALRFERVLKMGDNPTHDCPQCKQEVPRLWEGFGFGFEASPGAPTGNTGVHGQDYPTADQAVGRSAADRWTQYESRKKVKDEVRKQSGSHALIRHEGEGYVDYEPMTQVGLTAQKKIRRHLKELVPEAPSKKSPQ